MDFAVLLKAVPDLDTLVYDPRRKAVRREGAELFANPFDQRALRVALDLRRAGERVTVLSMGPEGAAPSLREAIALGADRAFLVSDPALAGSDTWVTAHVLTRACHVARADVVFAGQCSTDAETGQVPAEIAALLGVPIVSGVQAIHRLEDSGFECVRDTDDGWERFRVRAPCVVSVGEKVAKLRHADAAVVDALPVSAIRRFTAADLGMAHAALGEIGSATVVEELVEEAPTRTPLRIDGADIAQAIGRAVARIEELWAGPVSESLPLAPCPQPLDPNAELAVLVTGETGGLDRHGTALVSEIRRGAPRVWPAVLWVGPDPTPPDLQRLACAGARAVRRIPLPTPSSSSEVAHAVSAWLGAHPTVAGVLFAADSFGREVAGQVAARGGWGLTGDAIGLRVAPDGTLRWKKTAFGGHVIAEVRSRVRPSLATMRAGICPELEVPDPVELAPEIWSAPPFRMGPERLESGVRADDHFGDLDQARIIVSVGMGVGGPDGIQRIRPTLEAWSAALAATRRVVDAGWVSRHRQVGLTGRSLAPDLAVLLGTSGKANHLVGWKRARVILAINADPAAPVFGRVDVGLVGRWEDLLPPLTEALIPLADRRWRPPGSPTLSPPR
ncbi:MAG: FAD-binding protein [Thermoplasmata archaeon]|nr:FAD-binding protein [Thermoplasmata archaeon]